MVYSFNINTTLNDASLKEIRSFFPDFPCVETVDHCETINHCLAPYGLFCFCDTSAALVLFDIASHNYILLPKLSEYLCQPVGVYSTFDVCVNSTVYVMSRVFGIKDVSYLDLQNPAYWHYASIEEGNWRQDHGACAIDSKIYFICPVFHDNTEIIGMLYYETKSNRGWHKCCPPPLDTSFVSRMRITLIAADKDILLFGNIGGYAKYSTEYDQWTKLTTPDRTISFPLDIPCYVGGYLVVIQKCMERLFIYDIHVNKFKLVGSFEIPDSMRSEVMHIGKAT